MRTNLPVIIESDDQRKDQIMEYLLQEENEFAPESIAKSLSLPLSIMLEILCDEQFVTEFHQKKLQTARLFFDVKVIPKLETIVKTGSDKDAIAAAKALSEIVGYRQRVPLIAVEQNFGNDFSIEEMIRRLDEKNANTRKEER